MNHADDRDRRLAECVEHFTRLRREGRDADTRELLALPDDVLREVASILEAEAALDGAIEPRSGAPFPREWGAFTLISELGRGAAGTVFEAAERATGRRVALKLLRAGRRADTVQLERFRREAAVLRAVRHPHLAAFAGSGESDGQPYGATELADGPTLHAAARNGPPAPVGVLALEFAGLADALHALHCAGFLHRDVKPANVLVTAGGRLVLADLGLALDTGSERLTLPGDAIGTLRFMSPEQLEGRADVDARADVFGLAATFRAVFPASAVPQRLDAVLTKALDPDRNRRHASAAELRDALRNAVS